MEELKLRKVEVAVWTIFAIIWWLASLTILLPFLCMYKCSKYLRGKWFSLLYSESNNPIESWDLPLRQKVFDVLKADLPQRDSTSPIKILEIGIGLGDNLMCFPENSQLTALDENAGSAFCFHNNKRIYPHIIFDRFFTSCSENMKDIEDSSMDVVVSTYVLCSVKSVDDSLREIIRVLKPDGKLLFLEHIGFPESEWKFSFQIIVNPLWFIYNDGCHLTRHIDDNINEADFSHVRCDKILPDPFAVFIGPQIYGLATK